MPGDRAADQSTAKQKQARFKQALQEDWAARRLTLEYQPQVNLRKRRIVRFEALLRWRREASEIVSPELFIPLAEEMGIIGEVGQWVLQTACAAAVRWPADVGVAANVSALALQNRGLAGLVQRALAETGLAASRLELEVTENNEIEANSQSLDAIEQIRKLGVRITIDDLDVGYSSLRYLLDFPFDKVKVDGLYAASITRTDRRGEAAREIMRAIAGLCRNLRIDSLAEGVETAEQLALVMQADFDEVQGFIFGKSVPADDVPGMFQQVERVWRELPAG